MFKKLLYEEDLQYINECNLPWDLLKGKSILITGATGLIGSVLLDSLMYRNVYKKSEIMIWALARNENIIKERFGNYLESKCFNYIKQDVSLKINIDFKIDYIIHAASKGDPYSFASDPVGVMNANYQGMYQVLELARKQNSKVIFISSGEIYGNQPTALQKKNGFIESDYGYIDILSPRSGYASSKRAAETLCAAYISQYNLNVNVARPCHTYGYSMLDSDSRVVGEFLRKANKRETIIMKSQGLQERSYCYVADTVTAIYTILLLGKNGQSYNIANRKSNTTIRNIAMVLAEVSGVDVVFEEANEFEKKGYSDINRAVLNPTKLELLGWNSRYGINEGMSRILAMMQ